LPREHSGFLCALCGLARGSSPAHARPQRLPREHSDFLRAPGGLARD
jgi:hypothetical protein